MRDFCYKISTDEFATKTLWPMVEYCVSSSLFYLTSFFHLFLTSRKYRGVKFVYDSVFISSELKSTKPHILFLNEGLLKGEVPVHSTIFTEILR